MWFQEPSKKITTLLFYIETNHTNLCTVEKCVSDSLKEILHHILSFHWTGFHKASSGSFMEGKNCWYETSGHHTVGFIRFYMGT